MVDPIDFYFDFSSPYAYFMAENIDTIAARYGREVRWHPYLLGAVYKKLGTQPLTVFPLKGPYAVRDIERSARFMGLKCNLPEIFPVATQHAARAYYWLEERDPALARRFALATLRAYFSRGRDISQLDVVLDTAADLDADRTALAAALASDELKVRLRSICDAAIECGVFGSPYVIIDSEPFWGVDRLPQIERWLETGGF